MILYLSLAAAAATPALPLCGAVEAADGTALPAAARAHLIPMERGYDWELGVFAGRFGAEPVVTGAIDGGRYCLTAPGAGIWKVVVRAPGFVPMSRFPLPVTGPLELPAVRLSRDVGIRVEVKTADGEAWVVAHPADRRYWAGLAGDGWRPEVRFGRVDADGRLTLPRAPGEEVELQAFAAGSVATATARGGGSSGSVRLELGRPATRRSIQVVDERGKAFPEVVVALAEHGWPVAMSDERGRLALFAGPSDPAPLLLEARDGRRRVVRLPALPDPPDPASEDRTTRLELPDTPHLRGRVVGGARRQGLPGALVWLRPDPGTHTESGPEGEYDLPGGGRERLQVQADAAEYLPRAVVVEAADLAAGRPQELVLQPAASALGRVVDPDGAPLLGVTLEAVPQAPANRSRPARPAGAPSRARTDADGRFRLAGLRPSVTYEVAAKREGFVTRKLPGVVLPTGGRSTDLGTLVLKPGARLEGRVGDARGRPLEGAEVRVREAGGMPIPATTERLRERPPDAVTGPDGRFVVPDLTPGRPVDLLTSHRGYLPAWTLGVEPPRTEPVTVVLADASRLTGSLVDQDGDPVPGARVDLSWTRPLAGTVGLEPLRPGSRSTETDARGEFSFDELTPGRVEVSAQAEGFLPGRPTVVALPAGEEVTAVRLVLERGAVVEGRIYGPDGEPVEGAQLRIETATALSGAEGNYRIEGVSQGVKGLFAFHPDYRRLVREIHVEPGVNAVDLYFEDGWSVSGRTVDEAGDPVAGARVELRPDRPYSATGYWTSSGEDGGFRLVVSEEGTFRLTATRDGFAAGEIGGIEVRSAPVDGVDVTLMRGSSVTGRILGIDADELAGVTVEARREDRIGEREAVHGTVDHRGRYAVHHLAPGSWRIQAQLEGGRRHAAATVTLDAGAPQVERDLEFGTGLRLTGRLLSAGEPVAAAHVSLSGLTATGERSVLSAHDGFFRIEDLAPGRYRLHVLDRSRALTYVQEVELTGDRDLVIELESAPLVGAVTAAGTGEPLEDALVYVRRLLGADGETGFLITVPTDATGGFVVAHLTPGHYLVSARKEGYAPEEQSVEVEHGATPPPVLLHLAETGGLTLTVHLESGGVPRMVTASAFDPSGRMLLTDTRLVSDRGFVYFDQIPPGTWNLLVSTPGVAPVWITAEVPGSAPEVTLPPAAPLLVRVPALEEADAAGTLTVTLPNGDPYFQVEPGGAIRSGWPLSAGVVTVADVPAGVWSLRVDGAQGGTWLGTVVTDGRTPSQVSLE